MVFYILRRLLTLPLMLFLISAVLFFFILLIPVEQRAQAYLPAGNAGKTAEQEQAVMQAVIDKYGLDQPFPVQYIKWLQNLGRGDWGFSKDSRQPVMEVLLQRFPATLEMMLFALIPSVFLSIWLGERAAFNHNRWIDNLIRGGTSLGWAFPPFILGLILLNIFYAWQGWFPPMRLSLWASILVKSEAFRAYTGFFTLDALLNGNLELFMDALNHLVLPVLTLALVQTALLTRVMRASTLDVMKRDYLVTARAKGLSEDRIFRQHARPNAILPVVSTAGIAIPMWLSSVVVIEVIFHFEGVGFWAARAAQGLEIPAVVGFVLFSCTLTVLISLGIDILYMVLNPLVRLE